MTVRLIALAALVLGSACSSAGPFVTNVSSDGNYGLVVEKCTVQFNGFTTTVSTGDCTSHTIKLTTPPPASGG